MFFYTFVRSKLFYIEKIFVLRFFNLIFQGNIKELDSDIAEKIFEMTKTI